MGTESKDHQEVKIIEIYESALCCSTGVCGPEPDKELIDLQNTINLLKKAGFEVKRFAINQVPLAFTSNPVVKHFIMTEGPAKLPLTLFNGEIIKKQGYPTLPELQEYLPELANIRPDNMILGIFG
ncbi:MAG: arsenite efflux transporter metallochaperone ArsD [Bacteroidetes bacterium]|nr:arsenite efflux transporter metallochaperone ArsD [Bacteroidota bacterium]